MNVHERSAWSMSAHAHVRTPLPTDVPSRIEQVGDTLVGVAANALKVIDALLGYACIAWDQVWNRNV